MLNNQVCLKWWVFLRGNKTWMCFIIYYPCNEVVLLCSSPVNGSREVSKPQATEWDPQLPTSRAETCRHCCGSLLSPTEGIIWPTREQEWAALQKYMNVSSSHMGWLHLALGAVDPRISLVVPWALPMEEPCWGAARQHRWGTGSLPWQGAGPAQIAHRDPQRVCLLSFVYSTEKYQLQLVPSPTWLLMMKCWCISITGVSQFSKSLANSCVSPLPASLILYLTTQRRCSTGANLPASF